MGRKERAEKALNEAELIGVSKGSFRCLNPELRGKRVETRAISKNRGFEQVRYRQHLCSIPEGHGWGLRGWGAPGVCITHPPTPPTPPGLGTV